MLWQGQQRKQSAKKWNQSCCIRQGMYMFWSIHFRKPSFYILLSAGKQTGQICRAAHNFICVFWLWCKMPFHLHPYWQIHTSLTWLQFNWRPAFNCSADKNTPLLILCLELHLQIIVRKIHFNSWMSIHGSKFQSIYMWRKILYFFQLWYKL